MKGPSLKNFIPILIAVAFFFFLYVATSSEIKRINREKLSKREILNERKNRIEAMVVEVQKLSSEERIVGIAQDSLGLIRPEDNLDQIEASKEQIQQVEKLVNDKYD
jgi:cell division protein FtsL